MGRPAGWHRGRSGGTEAGLMLNLSREAGVCRFAAGILKALARAVIVCMVVLLGRHFLLSAQTLRYTKPPNVKNGEKVYKGGCIACHGNDGKGAPQASTVFKRRDTFPDFTD